MKKTYVLDTSVYLTSANAIYAYGNDDIVVPLKVLEEIDKHKSRTDVVGQNARHIIRIFDELRERGNLQKGLRIRKGSGIVSVSALGDDTATLNSLKTYSLDPGIPDNHIIGVALREKLKNPKKKVILVTRDIHMRVVSDSVGLQTESYDAQQVVNDSSELFPGFKDVLVDHEFIDQFYDGKDMCLDDKHFRDLVPNEFVMLVSNNSKTQTALARFISKNEPLRRVKQVKRNSKIFGVETRNREQTFAMDLLLDPEVPIVTLVGKAGSGKAHPLNSKLLTPSGWKTMGEIKVGDNVISVDGKPTRVNGVFPQGKKDIYKVSFTDGTSVECCKEHLWKTKTSLERDQNKDGEIRSLEEIMHTLRYAKSQKRNHSIPMVEPIEFAHLGMDKLDLDPYLLGCLLGDGSFRHTLSFSTGDEEILNVLSPLILKEDCSFSKRTNKFDHSIVQQSSSRKPGLAYNQIKRKIEALGLWEKKSHEKFVPKQYMFASLEDRISLLQGLMDTDGTVSKNGNTVSFTTVSKELSENVQFLVQSLGGTGVTASRQTTYTYDGERRLGKVSYRTYIVLPNEINPFLLKRKANRVVKRTKYFPRRYIDKVEFVGEKEAQCISIEHSEHLYLTDNCVVTHNTLCAIAAGLAQVMEKEEDTKESIYRKLIVSRPVQPMGRDIGYLPGTMEEKMLPWLAPIQDNLQNLLGDKATLEDYICRGIIEIEALTYIRGRSIANAYMIIDEAQNLSVHEMKTIITRVGEGTKIVFTGDIEQIDNAYVNDTSNGLAYAVEKFKTAELAGHVTLQKGERSPVASLAAKIL